MTYAASIRALRTGRNWTQGDLAKQIGGGITNQSVSGWERGISKPSRDNIFELSRIFGVPLEQFLPEDDRQNSLQPGQDTAFPGPVSLVFVAIEETLRAAGISEPAAAEIAGVVEFPGPAKSFGTKSALPNERHQLETSLAAHRRRFQVSGDDIIGV
jgi:DNA-binding XRE family transcriptional regulator